GQNGGATEMPRFGCAAKALARERLQWEFGKRRDPVIAGLTADRDMAVAEFPEPCARKEVLPALDFLQAEKIRLRLAQEARDEIKPQADGVDVPGRDSQCHRRKKSAQLRRRLGALRFHACAGREAGAGKLIPSARRG